jgi:hypothetical protein
MWSISERVRSRAEKIRGILEKQEFDNPAEQAAEGF